MIREASTRLHRPQRRRSQGAADMSGDRALAGWVLDERKAYRQLPIRPDLLEGS